MRRQAWRRPILELAVTAATLGPAFVIFYHSFSGDASIFFTFFKRFFTLPFSYQPGTVSFGASSPLHVLVNAPIHLAAGQYWLPVAKAFNYLLIVFGVCLLNRALRGDLVTLSVLLLLTVLNRALLITTAQLYETGLTFFVVSVTYFFVKRRLYGPAILMAGGLYLARPEVALVTIVLDGYLWYVSGNRRRVTGLILLSAIPATAYHAYIYLHTGAILPSSVYMRGVEALEHRVSWVDALTGSIRLLQGGDGAIYLVGLVSLLVLGARRRVCSYAEELIFMLPVGVLYLAVPPGHYIIRYLLPITPIIQATIARELRVILNDIFPAQRTATPPGSPVVTRRTDWACAALLLILVLGTYRGYLSYLKQPRYDYDTLLLRDLAAALNEVAGEGDRLFLYEIQAQYYLKAFCYSPDSLVGNQLLDVVHKRNTYEDFIVRHRVNFIVTANAFNYRKVFAGTLLEKLYLHDLSSRVGDTVTLNGLRFRKILTSPVFADPRYYRTVSFSGLNVGDSLRLYGKWNRLWVGHHPMWNSVYAVQP